jgi:hypothetical protein
MPTWHMLTHATRSCWRFGVVAMGPCCEPGTRVGGTRAVHHVGGCACCLHGRQERWLCRREWCKHGQTKVQLASDNHGGGAFANQCLLCRTRAHIHTHTHTHTRARTHARTHTHTHTHTYIHTHTQGFIVFGTEGAMSFNTAPVKNLTKETQLLLHAG